MKFRPNLNTLCERTNPSGGIILPNDPPGTQPPPVVTPPPSSTPPVPTAPSPSLPQNPGGILTPEGPYGPAPFVGPPAPYTSTIPQDSIVIITINGDILIIPPDQQVYEPPIPPGSGSPFQNVDPIPLWVPPGFEFTDEDFYQLFPEERPIPVAPAPTPPTTLPVPVPPNGNT